MFIRSFGGVYPCCDYLRLTESCRQALVSVRHRNGVWSAAMSELLLKK